MKNEEIDKILNLLDSKDYEAVRSFLKKERLYNTINNRMLTPQEQFELYMTNPLFASTYYAKVDGNFIFSNGCSIFMLNEPLQVKQEWIANQNENQIVKNSPDFLISVYNTLTSSIKNLQTAHLYVKGSRNESVVIAKTLKGEYPYNMEQIKWLKIFLGNLCEVKVNEDSDYNVLSAENDKGRCYIRELKK